MTERDQSDRVLGPPSLNEHGLLAPGVHDLGMEDLRQLFGSFRRSDRRPRLFEKLLALVKDVTFASPDIVVVIDGSFIMACVDEPGDIDVILILPETWDLEEDLPPYKYNVVAKARVRRRYGFDVLIAREGDDSVNKATEFFSQVNTKWLKPLNIPAGTKKGLVRIRP